VRPIRIYKSFYVKRREKFFAASPKIFETKRTTSNSNFFTIYAQVDANFRRFLLIHDLCEIFTAKKCIAALQKKEFLLSAQRI
jgi:hypothetical protein